LEDNFDEATSVGGEEFLVRPRGVDDGVSVSSPHENSSDIQNRLAQEVEMELLMDDLSLSSGGGGGGELFAFVESCMLSIGLRWFMLV